MIISALQYEFNFMFWSVRLRPNLQKSTLSYHTCLISSHNIFLGNDHESCQKLLENLWAYKEWKREKQIESDMDFVGRAEQLRRHMSDRLSSQNTIPKVVSRTQTLIGTGATEVNVCVVCEKAQREVVLTPCGHLASCQSCYRATQQCPVCGAYIRGAIRSYI